MTDDSRAALQPLVKHVIPQLDVIKVGLVTASHELKSDFNAVRKVLQSAAIERLGNGSNKLPGTTFTPIRFVVRLHKGSLELRWKRATIRSSGSRTIYTDLRRDGKGRYSARALSQVARAWELDLVLEVEQRAQLIRKRWQLICRSRECCRLLLNTTDLKTHLHSTKKTEAPTKQPELVPMRWIQDRDL